jgi:phospholipid-binding lipoprotein MlaA
VAINRRWITTAILACVLVSGCATVPAGKRDPRDRFERANRSVYKFNTALDHAILRPVARTYVRVTPAGARRCVVNFLGNLTYPTTIVNDVLQGKLRDGLSDSARFGINTVAGIGGLFDPASHWNFDRHDEDFGQTLGKWGVPSGPYLMLPLLGPSTVRDSPARVVDRFTNPEGYITDTAATVGLAVSTVVNARAGLLSSDALVDGAYDPYAFVRDAWLQRREYKVRDGNVPPEPDLGDTEAPPHNP